MLATQRAARAAGTKKAAPSERLTIVTVGAGGQAAANIHELDRLGLVDFAAFCDVDEERAAETYNRFPKAKRYKDFRRMFDQEQHFDAVLVATPDHMHALATLAAIQLGKHVYCEKPLTHTVEEARIIATAARGRGGVATQMGNQGMAFEGPGCSTSGSGAGSSARCARCTPGRTVPRTMASSSGRSRPPRRHAPHPHARLGSLAGARAGAALSPRLCALCLARLVGF